MFLDILLGISLLCAIFLVVIIVLAAAQLYYDYYHLETGLLFRDDPYFGWIDKGKENEED